MYQLAVVITPLYPAPPLPTATRPHGGYIVVTDSVFLHPLPSSQQSPLTSTAVAALCANVIIPFINLTGGRGRYNCNFTRFRPSRRDGGLRGVVGGLIISTICTRYRAVMSYRLRFVVVDRFVVGLPDSLLLLLGWVIGGGGGERES